MLTCRLPWLARGGGRAAQDHLGGLQANKQKLTSARHGVLKDNQTLAFYNVREGEMLLLDVKERGGRAVKK
jgi:hypothetical protein